ncbi:MAG: FAD-dependent oxidoreductase [Streptosporangiales bacterium]
MTTDVVVVGAGPVGLMAACELRLAGVDVVVLEQAPQPRTLPKANGLMGQIVTLLDQRGLLERFSVGSRFAGPAPGFQFGDLPLDFSRLDSSPLDLLLIPQPQLEQLLAERAGELGAAIERGHTVRTVTQDAEGVSVDIDGSAGKYRLDCRYLVGCDGGRSLVREQAGIGFSGETYPELTRLGHVHIPDALTMLDDGEVELPGGRRLQPGFTSTERGRLSLASFTPGVLIIAATEDDPPPVDIDTQVTLTEMSDAVTRVLDTEVPMGEPIWLSRTQVQARLADTYQAGKVFIAGDAAHLFPAGGAGLNIGLMDAVNLGWKLAADLHGWAPVGLLDSYHTERHQAGTRALLQSRAQRALGKVAGEDGKALRALFRELVGYPEPLRHVGEMLAGADNRYDMTPSDETQEIDPHPLLGRLLPDLSLHTTTGATRTTELMRSARGVLLDLTGQPTLTKAAAPWSDRVDVITAIPTAQTAPAAMLLRPDGYIAWTSTSDSTTAGLTHALHRWFGSPARQPAPRTTGREPSQQTNPNG